MSNADGNDFLDLISNFIDKIFKKKMSSVIQVATATVISMNDTIPTVRLLSSPNDGSEDFTVENESGKTLVANDIVRLFYWGTLSNAYVGKKG